MLGGLTFPSNITDPPLLEKYFFVVLKANPRTNDSLFPLGAFNYPFPEESHIVSVASISCRLNLVVDCLKNLMPLSPTQITFPFPPLRVYTGTKAVSDSLHPFG